MSSENATNTVRGIPKRLTDELWKRGELSFLLDEHQIEIYNQIRKMSADKNEAFLCCARRFGKSWLTCTLAMETAMKTGGVVRIVGATKDQVREIVDDALVPLTASAPEGLIRRTKATGRWYIGKGEIRIGSIEQGDTLTGGANAVMVVMEEGRAARSADYKHAATSLLGPQLARTKGRIYHISTLPEDPDHYLTVDVYDRCEADSTLFIRDIYKNKSMDEEMIAAQMKLCGGEESDAWRREFLCIRERNSQALIVPEFSSLVHVVEITPPAKAFWSVAGDYGGSRDHFHAVLYCWDFERARAIILDEVHFAAGTPNSVIVPALKSMEGTRDVRNRRWLDIAGQTAIDLYNDYKYPVTLPAKDDADAALNALRLAFTNQQIEISPRCVATINALNVCLWNRQRTDWERTEKHGHADAIAALVYAWRHLNRDNPYPFELNKMREWLAPCARPEEEYTKLSSLITKVDRRRMGRNLRR